MTSQKDSLHKAAQDFSLLDQCFPRLHQHTEAGLHHVQFQNQNCCLRPPARTVLLKLDYTIDCPSVEVVKSTDHVYQVSHVTRVNHANQVPFKTKDDVFSGWRNSYQVPPAVARTNKSNFGGWLFRQG